MAIPLGFTIESEAVASSSWRDGGRVNFKAGERAGFALDFRLNGVGNEIDYIPSPTILGKN